MPAGPGSKVTASNKFACWSLICRLAPSGWKYYNFFIKWHFHHQISSHHENDSETLDKKLKCRVARSEGCHERQPPGPGVRYKCHIQIWRYFEHLNIVIRWDLAHLSWNSYIWEPGSGPGVSARSPGQGMIKWEKAYRAFHDVWRPVSSSLNGF